MQDIETMSVAVVGAGAMGSGIAQIAAVAGLEVRVFDARDGAAAAACERVARRLAERAEAGKLDAGAAELAGGRLQAVSSVQALSSCNIVIEAIVEDLEAKRELFSRLEAIVPADTILASNTSSLPIGAIAAGLAHRERVAGLHFFNPVPVMRLVEVIPGPDTSAPVLQILAAFAERVGRVPVTVRDSPGFLVNFGGRAYATEALALVHEQVATPAQIDAVMRDCCGFRMGPFELMDLTGVDVNFPVTQFIHDSFFGDPRLRSSPLHRYLFETGQLGRKTGRGFFDYQEGSVKPSPDTTSDVPAATEIILAEDCAKLRGLLAEYGVEIRDRDDGTSPILAAPVGEDCSAFASRMGVDFRRLVALDMAVDTTGRITVMTPPGANADVLGSIISLLSARRSVTAIKDSPGFIAQRICAMIANLGCEMAQMGLAEPAAIDTAMRLGLNYPLGPLELADRWGAGTMLRILAEAQKLTGDDRYRPSQWLRRRAELGLPVQTAA